MLKGWIKSYKLLILLISLGLVGCTSWSWNGTRVNGDNRLISAAGEPLFSTVYFLRPRTERAMGFSDDALTVSLDGSELLTIEKGDYTLVYMRPRVRTTMTLENRTEVGPFWTANSAASISRRATWICSRPNSSPKHSVRRARRGRPLSVRYKEQLKA